jgi:hypothetical protein
MANKFNVSTQSVSTWIKKYSKDDNETKIVTQVTKPSNQKLFDTLIELGIEFTITSGSGQTELNAKLS